MKYILVEYNEPPVVATLKETTKAGNIRLNEYPSVLRKSNGRYRHQKVTAYEYSDEEFEELKNAHDRRFEREIEKRQARNKHRQQVEARLNTEMMFVKDNFQATFNNLWDSRTVYDCDDNTGRKVTFVIFSGPVPPNQELKHQFSFVTATAKFTPDDSNWYCTYTRINNDCQNATTTTNRDGIVDCLWEIVRDCYYSR